MAEADCVFCNEPGGEILWQDDRVRVIRVSDTDYPGYLRVVWQSHVREMTDLDERDRAHCMRVVFAAENALRVLLRPDKINLAALGNMVPHIHWHVVPRYRDDAHFPNALWGERLREGPKAVPADLSSRLAGQLAALLDAR